MEALEHDYQEFTELLTEEELYGLALQYGAAEQRDRKLPIRIFSCLQQAGLADDFVSQPADRSRWLISVSRLLCRSINATVSPSPSHHINQDGTFQADVGHFLVLLPGGLQSLAFALSKRIASLPAQPPFSFS